MEKHETEFVVVGVGELLWDEFPAGPQIGGAPANFVYHAQALGAASSLISATGGDDSGQAILNELEGLGLDTGFVSLDTGHPTGSVSVKLDAHGVPAYTIHENVAWDFIPQTAAQIELAERADALCFGSLAQRSVVSRRTIRSILEATPPDCLRVFDINLRQSFYDRAILVESLSRANVLKVNDQELVVIAELNGMTGEPTGLLDQLATAFDLNVIALTLGDGGCILHTNERTVRHEGFPVDGIKDTVGAGDCFSAVLTMGLLKGEPLDSVAEQANRMAAYVCTQAGAMPVMP